MSKKQTQKSSPRPVGRPTQLFKIDAPPEAVARAVLWGGAPKRPKQKKPEPAKT